ncbi:MAG: peptidoglycan-binding domain-containing protein [Pseudomonadota bacterium]
MLPTVTPSTIKHPLRTLSALRTTAVAAVTALSLAVLSASPAQAWGEREQGFVAGVATSVIVGAIANDIRQKNRGRQQQQYYQPPRYQPQPQYYQGPRHYQQPRPVYAPQPSYSIYSTPPARAFSSYSLTERKAIQRRLATAGYYRSGIDGSFGPGTYNAVVAYARDTRQAGNLDSTAGSYGIYDGLLY